MGITAREEQMIALSEQGLSAPEVADQLGLGDEYVARRLKDLCPGAAGDRAWEKMVKAGSAALLEAIRLHHPEMVEAR